MTASQLRIGYRELDCTVWDVDDDRVAIFNECDRPDGRSVSRIEINLDLVRGCQEVPHRIARAAHGTLLAGRTAGGRQTSINIPHLSAPQVARC